MMRGWRAALLGLAGLAACTGSVAPPATTQEGRPTLPGLGSALTPGPVLQSNRDIAQDFADLVFYRESGVELPRLLRFSQPVRIALSGSGLSAYRATLEALLARLRTEAGIDIARGPSAEADILIAVAPSAGLSEVFPGAQCFVVPDRLDWPGFRVALDAGALPGWDELQALSAATIFIRDDAAPQMVRECLEEELAQALGPANDLFRLRDSVFNDDNVHSRLTRFDLLILRVLYDPRLSPGMPRREAQRAARRVLDEINPEGRRIPARRGLAPQPRWEAIVKRLFGQSESIAEQRLDLRRALRLARRFPQPDHRLATTLDFLAALEFRDRPELAEGLLQRALDSLPDAPGDLRPATIRVYLAQTRLALGRPEAALALVEAALPALAAHDAAPRIARALSVRTDALSAMGRAEEAAESAIDSRAWNAYVRGSQVGRLFGLRDR